MHTCPNPSCKKPLKNLTRTCAFCQADLSLLVDFANQMDDGLRRAERLAREGKVGEAVWAYLEVLEVDPDNSTARAQVGQVAAAVRHFDTATLGRRPQDWRHSEDEAQGHSFAHSPAFKVGLVAVLILVAAWIGYLWGSANP